MHCLQSVLNTASIHPQSTQSCLWHHQESHFKRPSLQESLQWAIGMAELSKRLPKCCKKVLPRRLNQLRILQETSYGHGRIRETGLHGPHVKLAQAMEALTGKFFGKQLILNVDGCIAAIISDMGFDWRLGKGFFIVSRTPGLIAHMSKIYYDKPYKAAHWSEIDYTGPPERKVPGT